jgi:hypothetical protein
VLDQSPGVPAPRGFLRVTLSRSVLAWSISSTQLRVHHSYGKGGLSKSVVSRHDFAPCRRVGRTMGGVCVTLGEKALGVR